MAFIGRKRRVGFGKESTAGTAVTATDWIPVTKPSIKPASEKAVDDSAYGNIDEIFSKETVKNMTMISLEGIVRDEWFGLFLLGAFGTETLCAVGVASSGSGTPVVGQTFVGGTSGATGTLKVIDGTTYYLLVSTGTITSGETLTFSGGATKVFTYDTGVRAHLFERANTNAHPTFTVYKVDDVDTMRAAYCMLNSLDIEAVVGDFVKFVIDMMGKSLASTSATPSFDEQNMWLAKHATLRVADDIASLSAATAISVSRSKFSIAKNLTDYQAFGDNDVASFHNQQFGITGEIDALFTDATLRDYMINSTKKAMRLQLVNSDVTIGASSNPKLILDLARVSFEDWSDTDSNNELVRQSMSFTGEFDNDDGFTGRAILINAKTTAY